MFNLIPREEKFFELFEAQAAHNVEAAKVFIELISKWSQESPLFRRLQDIEHEADITTHEVYDRLNRTFITPFDREDIHELVGGLDDIIDGIDALAKRFPLFHVKAMEPVLRPIGFNW